MSKARRVYFQFLSPKANQKWNDCRRIRCLGCPVETSHEIIDDSLIENNSRHAQLANVVHYQRMGPHDNKYAVNTQAEGPQNSNIPNVTAFHQNKIGHCKSPSRKLTWWADRDDWSSLIDNLSELPAPTRGHPAITWTSSKGQIIGVEPREHGMQPVGCTQTTQLLRVGSRISSTHQ